MSAAALNGPAQLTITGEFEEPAVRLTDRQEFARAAIERLGPIAADELGALLHERRGRHGAEERCRWCCQEGKTAGRELRAKGLVTLRRGEGWVLRGAQTAAGARDGAYDPATAEIPF